MNPTTWYLNLPGEKDTETTTTTTTTTAAPASPLLAAVQHHVYHIWRSRDNRKGRHAIVVRRDFYLRHLHHGFGLGVGHGLSHEELAAARRAAHLRATNSARAILHGIRKMAVCWPVWDISFDMALLFAVGSAIWVVNSFFAWLPLQAPSTAFAGEQGLAGGITAVVGALVFEVGALFGLLEAVNENRGHCFGWALETALQDSGLLLHPRPADCRHHHRERWRLFQRRQAGSDTQKPRRQWSWCPSWHELRTHYVREIGFWANAVQMAGATVFWISGFTGLPPVLDRLSPAAVDGVFWLPQVVGGVGFVVSSLLFMLETQPRWYVPAPGLLGWHVGLWNLVGALGFTLCGALGFASATSRQMEYASTLSTFLGSWAFLIGSLIQWYESLDKYPVSIKSSIHGH